MLTKEHLEILTIQDVVIEDSLVLVLEVFLHVKA